MGVSFQVFIFIDSIPTAVSIIEIEDTEKHTIRVFMVERVAFQQIC